MEIDLEIGNRIRKLREELSLNRNYFSEHINISESYLAQIERGEKPVTLKVVCAVCNFTDCSADYLIYGKDDDNTKKKRLLRLINRSPEKKLDLYYDVLHAVKVNYDK